MIPKRSVFFGTKDRMSWIKAPAINIGRNRNRWQASGTYLNGGGYILNSHYSHRMYTLSWNLMESDSVREIENYALGVYGDGVIYFLDPFAENLLPLNWSVPFLAGDDAPPLIYDSPPEIVEVVTGLYPSSETFPPTYPGA